MHALSVKGILEHLCYVISTEIVFSISAGSLCQSEVTRTEKADVVQALPCKVSWHRPSLPDMMKVRSNTLSSHTGSDESVLLTLSTKCRQSFRLSVMQQARRFVRYLMADVFTLKRTIAVELVCEIPVSLEDCCYSALTREKV